ncbi:hypothetical protein [Komagataeibacter swingsii]|uniref:Uncharacterized protein n=1 Tax=Komagataeibacter swingsii TaxID=215220 RepID=A0A2V4QXD3_9PROT|nr:hypothetical protein [Komagataeibacter swingsii]PYD68097.1 hypothetical protein CFR76_17095 [Komagataeibacter swingsii]
MLRIHPGNTVRRVSIQHYHGVFLTAARLNNGTEWMFMPAEWNIGHLICRIGNKRAGHAGHITLKVMWREQKIDIFMNNIFASILFT